MFHASGSASSSSRRKEPVNASAPRMPQRYSRAAVRGLALVALVVGLAVPASAGAGVARTGVLHGVVTHGLPCSPGSAAPCGSPVAGVTIVFLRHGHAVAQTTSAADGTYRIKLRGGRRYGITVRGHARSTPSTALVRRGHVTKVDIAIDTLSN